MTFAPRLYYLDDIPTPYRLGVQRRIASDWPGAFKIAYCAASEPGRTWSFDFSDLDVEILPGKQFRPRRQVNPMSVKWNPAIGASLDAFRPDVVVLSGYLHPSVYLAALWCKRNRIPYAIMSETSARNTMTGGAKWQIKKRLAGWLVKGMAYGLPVGREAGDYFKRLGAVDIPVFYFPNTPDTAQIAAAAERLRHPDAEAELRWKLNIPGSSKIVLFAGRMIGAKRPADALAAFGKIGSVQDSSVLVFVGDGPLLEDLKRSATCDGRVIFTGWLEDPAVMAGLMAISALMVLPSEHETWGAVVNEAMAAGTPVIASDRVGAAAELISSGENGLIFPVGCVGHLAQAIESLLLNDELRLRMGQAAQRTALANGHEFATRNFIAGALYAISRRAGKAPAKRYSMPDALPCSARSEQT